VLASEGRTEATQRQYLYQSLTSGTRTRGGEVGGMVLVDILHTFARFLELEGVVTEDPLRALRRVKITKRLRQPFTQTEVIALWGPCAFEAQGPVAYGLSSTR
jgi:site-specific recombinase XerD